MADSTPIRKVHVASHGGPSVVSVVSSTISPPSVNEVQVAPLYSGFSGADVAMRNGTYPLGRKAPFTLGYSLTGRVVTSHASSTKFRPGDMVTCLTVYDAQATLVNLPEKYLVAVPDGVDPGIATSLCLDGVTAFQMVRRSAQVQKGQRVFIHGLSGSVGNATMTLCRQAGAEVYGTASPRNHAALREQGANPFAYSDKDWIKAMRKIGGVHAVFDPLGFESWDESYSILSDKEPSILVGYGGNRETFAASQGGPRSVVGPTAKLMLRNAKFWQGKRTTFYYVSRDDKNYEVDLKALLEMVRRGELDIAVKKVWDMDAIQDAHQNYGKAEGLGSMLIKISEDGAI